MCRLGLFFLANCCSSITLLSEFSCETEPRKHSTFNHSTYSAPYWTPLSWRHPPSSPSCCSPVRTCAAASPSSSRGGGASAGSSGTLAVYPPSCFYLWGSDRQRGQTIVQVDGTHTPCDQWRTAVTYTSLSRCVSHTSSRTRSSGSSRGSPQTVCWCLPSHGFCSGIRPGRQYQVRWHQHPCVCVCVCSSSPFKALVENLIGRQQPGLVGQLVDPGVLDTDVVKILTETDGHSSSNCVVQITIKKKKQGGDTPPVRRPLLASPPTSASQSRGWGSPVWLGLQGTTDRSHDKGHTTTVTWQHRCGSHSFWQDVKIYT